jgi:hypothetical protein
MRNYFILISILIILSCRNVEYLGIEDIPIIQDKFSLKDTILLLPNPSTKLVGKVLQEKIDSALHINSEYFALAKFNIPSMDSGKIHPFELFLFRVKISKTLSNLFITTRRLDNHIIDVFAFDPNQTKLHAVYPFSSEDNHDAIAIELLEDKSNSDSFNILEHRIDLINTGQFKFNSTVQANDEVFKKLNKTCEICGVYTMKENEFSIFVEIRDGKKEGDIAYQCELKTPKGCRIIFLNLEGKVKDDEISINPLIKMTLSEKSHKVKFVKYKTGCEEEELSGDFELNQKK